MKFITIASSVALALALGTELAAAECSKKYYQCGGKNWKGPTCCESGSTCVDFPDNPWYSQCVPNEYVSNYKSATTVKHTTTTDAPKHTTTTDTPKHTTTTDTPKHTTTTDTPKHTTTTEEPKHTTTTSKPQPSTPSKSSGSGYSPVSGGASGNGRSTRYWDCCKASCSWPGKADVTAPVDTCAKNGVSIVDDNTQSGCNGGSGYMCNNNQPWAVNDNLAYGFAAAAINGGGESRWCCSCFELTFTSTSIAGKKMVVQVTNTGGDLGGADGHFDLQLPGGGVGIFNGCASQWGAPNDGWGQRYGGISDASQCSQLPAALQAGCKFRFGWFKNADNPSVSFKEVTCPKEIVQRTGCQRK
ncbi:uncharacterized protein RHIMIDRAFT_263920 [Rhizopus microsporus ATCC 52813]|uniref:Cellulase n=3 Tax=Rhizopus microsporus TaxID=58291 RepID=A0A2G4SL36_RHIZD|nr:uncharacterized protein RHIMIDRAFT_263920 [Rhizopus microsporus ATCC 52813]PHZ09096.1 hypothetical protein RHIMIDRAFT_263920 [Rhizopus microsporus ATCC 52813]